MTPSVVLVMFRLFSMATQLVADVQLMLFSRSPRNAGLYSLVHDVPPLLVFQIIGMLAEDPPAAKQMLVVGQLIA